MLFCGKGGGIKYLETFRDIGAVVWRGGGIKYHYSETFRQIGFVLYGPVVSVPASE